MQTIHRIEAIESRAQEINLELARLCRLADVDYSTVWRWKTGASRPLLHNFETVTRKLDAKLEELETAIVERIQKAS